MEGEITGDWKGEGSLALIVGAEPRPGREPSSLAALMRGAADEVLEFATPADALDGLRTRAEHEVPARRVLFLVDQRGAGEVRWSSISMLVHVALGPVILLVDDAREATGGTDRLAGGARCLEERHLSRHPGLLVRAARRALDPRRSRATLGSAA